MRLWERLSQSPLVCAAAPNNYGAAAHTGLTTARFKYILLYQSSEEMRPLEARVRIR